MHEIRYRVDPDTGDQIFDVVIPGDAQGRAIYSFQQTGAAEDTRNFKNLQLSESKVREGSSNLFTLQNQYNDVSILDVARQDPSKVGVSGSIKKLFKKLEQQLKPYLIY